MMRGASIRAWVVACMVLALGVSLAACGGGDESTSGAETTTAETSASAETGQAGGEEVAAGEEVTLEWWDPWGGLPATDAASPRHCPRWRA